MHAGEGCIDETTVSCFKGLLSYGQRSVVTGEQRDYQTNQGYTEQTKGLSNKKTDLRASRRNKYRRDTIDAFSSEVISYLICILLSFSIFSALKIFILHTMHPCNTPNHLIYPIKARKYRKSILRDLLTYFLTDGANEHSYWWLNAVTRMVDWMETHTHIHTYTPTQYAHIDLQHKHTHTHTHIRARRIGAIIVRMWISDNIYKKKWWFN